jgi:hypothetical protein
MFPNSQKLSLRKKLRKKKRREMRRNVKEERRKNFRDSRKIVDVGDRKPLIKV